MFLDARPRWLRLHVATFCCFCVILRYFALCCCVVFWHIVLWQCDVDVYSRRMAGGRCMLLIFVCITDVAIYVETHLCDFHRSLLLLCAWIPGRPRGK